MFSLSHFPPGFPFAGFSGALVAVFVFLPLSLALEDRGWWLLRLLFVIFTSPTPPTAAATTGVALAIRLLYTEGLAGFADGCQHQDHEAPTHPHIPLGTLTLRTKVP